MTAKEAAQHASEHKQCTQAEIEKMIPVYPHPLPRRAWIKTFLKHLDVNDHNRFTGLK